MAKQETVSVEKVRAKFRKALGILYNPAPAYVPPEQSGKGRTRENVPWIIIIPELSVVTTVLDEDGDVIRGHINPRYAQTFASLLFHRLSTDEKLLASYQTQPETYELQDEYMGKLIPITFQV